MDKPAAALAPPEYSEALRETDRPVSVGTEAAGPAAAAPMVPAEPPSESADAPQPAKSATHSRKGKERRQDRGHRNRRDRSRSRSRDRHDRDRGRDKGRDRGRRDRSRSRSRSRRSRSRSRSRDRDRSRRGGRSRSRERDRRDRRERSRSRDRSRADRDRDRDRRGDRGGYASKGDNRNHDREQRGSCDRQASSSGSTSAAAAAAAAADNSAGDDPFGFSAGIVINHFVEVFDAKKRRVEQLMECIDSNSFQMVALGGAGGDGDGGGGTVLVPDATALQRGFESQTQQWKAEAAKRVFLEIPDSKAPTFAIDFYKRGKSPAFGVAGMSARPAAQPVVALYRVQRSKIANVWVAEDAEGIAEMQGATEEDVCASDAYMQALEVMVRPGGFNSMPKRYYNDYSKMEVWM